MRSPVLTLNLRARLWPYLGGIARESKIKALAIGGMADHVHALISLPGTVSVAKALQLLKGNSSKWIHDTFPQLRSFEWQEGYGAFCIGVSAVDNTVAYIRNQAEHHRKRSFIQEYITMLRRHGLEYEERMLDRFFRPYRDLTCYIIFKPALKRRAMVGANARNPRGGDKHIETVGCYANVVVRGSDFS
jgi:putative transposase